MSGLLQHFWIVSIIGFVLIFPLGVSASNEVGTGDKISKDDVVKVSVQRDCHGLVVDFKQQPIANVVVSLFSKKDSNLGKTQTDDQGKFIFFNVASSQQIIKVSHPNYEDVVKDSCGPDSLNLTFVLYPRRVHQSVTVTATRTPRTIRDVPSAVVVLTEKDLSQSPSLTIDDTLRQSPVFSLFSVGRVV